MSARLCPAPLRCSSAVLACIVVSASVVAEEPRGPSLTAGALIFVGQQAPVATDETEATKPCPRSCTPAAAVEAQAREIVNLIESVGPSVLEGSLFAPLGDEEGLHETFVLELCQPNCTDCPCADATSQQVDEETCDTFTRAARLFVHGHGGPASEAMPAACESPCRADETACPHCCRAARQGHLGRGCCGAEQSSADCPCTAPRATCDCRALPCAPAAPCDVVWEGPGQPFFADPNLMPPVDCPFPADECEACPGAACPPPAFIARVPHAGVSRHPILPPPVWAGAIPCAPPAGAFCMPVAMPGAPAPGAELDRKELLRLTARQLDDLANRLEDAEEFEAADGLRAQADRLRRQARPSEATATPATFLDEVPEPQCDASHAESLRQRLRETIEKHRLASPFSLLDPFPGPRN